MQITINIPEEFAAEALARGITTESYVESIVARESERPRGYRANGLLTLEEFEASLDRIAQFSDKIPFLPIEAFSRESIYADHD